jgi:hypothetical protein
VAGVADIMAGGTVNRSFFFFAAKRASPGYRFRGVYQRSGTDSAIIYGSHRWRIYLIH